MLPDNIWDELLRFEKLALDLACDGEEYGLTPEETDDFNDIDNTLADLIAKIGLREKK